MGRGMWAVVAVVPATLAALAGPAHAASRHDCGPGSATTVERNALVRVYGDSHGLHACSRRSGRKTPLGDRAEGLVLRGRYLSFAWHCRVKACFNLELLDVASGEYARETHLIHGEVLKLVASRRGHAAALIATADGSERFVLKFDSFGVEELDRGPDVRSLRLRGSRLHWLSGERARSAPVALVRRCGPARGVETVELSHDVRVYSHYVSTADSEYYDYFACLRPGGRPVKLTREDASIESSSGDIDANIDDFVFSGRLVGFAEVRCSGFGCDSLVAVYDVREGKRLRHTTTGGRAETVVMSSSGQAAALVSHQFSGDDPPDTSVFEIGHGDATELDRGPDIRDLTVDGSVASWVNGSESRSATLR